MPRRVIFARQFHAPASENLTELKMCSELIMTAAQDSRRRATQLPGQLLRPGSAARPPRSTVCGSYLIGRQATAAEPSGQILAESSGAYLGPP
ncbi:hypothetical protein SKAU_G00368460 [Synaphobranchus kaupii]|uniref:Uncharacterized protein n=1 Tax=Synaphobranchus kaupii TaxID=118154 RepID=A0A9Q1EFL5_SYNKA|nr:hypothetical protein SKAU_G00368460 [Synaphobranchus kaupii]